MFVHKIGIPTIEQFGEVEKFESSMLFWKIRLLACNSWTKNILKTWKLLFLSKTSPKTFFTTNNQPHNWNIQFKNITMAVKLSLSKNFIAHFYFHQKRKYTSIFERQKFESIPIIYRYWNGTEKVITQETRFVITTVFLVIRKLPYTIRRRLVFMRHSYRCFGKLLRLRWGDFAE